MSRAILYADGAARGNPGPAGAGAVLLGERGEVIAELTKYLGTATNNIAEYAALILGLEEAKRRGFDEIDIRMDSQLVVRQMSGIYRVRHPNMVPLAKRARELYESFPRRSIAHVRREQNAVADLLSNRAIDEGR
ncbi:MAG TPA: ribonuclease HI family protein [Candidatus Limnocylindria bacterium]|nr:ribonuclease HI family protein [Candidatus Limnocylindria bacterium]